MSEATGGGFSYAAAGVDIDAAERLVGRFAQMARLARRPEVLADVGPFAGVFHLQGRRDPVLVASCDGVGTKARVAALLGAYEALGRDLVSLNVNDVLTVGAEPLFFLDYVAHHGLPEDALLAFVQGMAEACRDVGCALLGGETAEMPDVYAEGDFDLAGFVVGAVERDGLIDGSRIVPGDALLGMPSNGLHTNGYSLVRKVFRVGVGEDPLVERRRLEEYVPELGCTLGEALLRAHRCYYGDVRPLLGAASPVKGIAHITGGGLPGNVPRILPEGLGARIDRLAWEVPVLFRLIQSRGGIEEGEMYRTFNMGVGLVLVVSADGVEPVRARLGEEAIVLGEVVRASRDERVVWR